MPEDSWDYWYPEHGKPEPEVVKLAEILRDRDAARILDFGCGTGRHSLYLAHEGFRVYTFDGSTSAVERVQQSLKMESLDADVRVWDMMKPLPFDDGFFDGIVATRVIHHTLMENIRKIAGEIDRVLKKSGYLVLQVAEYGGHVKIMREAPDKHRLVEPGTHVPLEGVEQGVPHHHFSAEELRELFRGYEVVDSHVESEHYSGLCMVARKP